MVDAIDARCNHEDWGFIFKKPPPPPPNPELKNEKPFCVFQIYSALDSLFACLNTSSKLYSFGTVVESCHVIYKNLLPVSVGNSELTQSGLLQWYVCCICSKSKS